MNRGEQQDAGSFWRVTLCSLLGPLVWALHLALVYGAQHVLCALGVADRAVYWFVIAVSVVAVAALLPSVVLPAHVFRRLGGNDWPEPTRQFLVVTMRLLASLSLAGVVWAGTAVVFLPQCTT